MWLNAPANHGLARTGKPPQLVNMFPHYLAMSEIPKESTHHIFCLRSERFSSFRWYLSNLSHFTCNKNDDISERDYCHCILFLSFFCHYGSKG